MSPSEWTRSCVVPDPATGRAKGTSQVVGGASSDDP